MSDSTDILHRMRWPLLLLWLGGAAVVLSFLFRPAVDYAVRVPIESISLSSTGPPEPRPQDEFPMRMTLIGVALVCGPAVLGVLLANMRPRWREALTRTGRVGVFTLGAWALMAAVVTTCFAAQALRLIYIASCYARSTVVEGGDGSVLLPQALRGEGAFDIPLHGFMLASWGFWCVVLWMRHPRGDRYRQLLGCSVLCSAAAVASLIGAILLWAGMQGPYLFLIDFEPYRSPFFIHTSRITQAAGYSMVAAMTCSAVALALLFMRGRYLTCRQQHPLCPCCDYDLLATVEAGGRQCPECGEKVPIESRSQSVLADGSLGD